MVKSLRPSLLPNAIFALFVLLSGISVAHALNYKVVYKFPTAPRYPLGPLEKGNDGALYGIVGYGGTNNLGAWYKLNESGDYQELSSFDTSKTGIGPVAPVNGPGGIYGSTFYGGANGGGTIYRVGTNGAIKILAPLPTSTIKYRAADGLVSASNGFIYGILHDNIFRGRLFRMNTNGAITVLGSGMIAEDMLGTSMIQAQDGNFYGTCPSGGTVNNYGFIFKLTPSGVFTKLHSFLGPDGVAPVGRLLEGTNGVFYGVTLTGGENSDGTVFKITADGTFTSLHSFVRGIDGAAPASGLVKNGDGIFGVTENSLFQVTTNETVSVITMIDPSLTVIGTTVGDDGNFYATSIFGGDDRAGAILRITLAGDVTTFHSFTQSPGIQPTASLQLLNDGSLLGTADRGGENDYGTLFSLSADGTFTGFKSFNANQGFPQKVVSMTTNGDRYLTAARGGNDGEGGIYSLSPGGDLNLITSFAGTENGRVLNGGLVTGNDGRLYGVANEGGDGYGTIFAITSDGTLTVLTRFARTNGANPCGPLVLAGDGNFYGVTSHGGVRTNYGTLFRMSSDGTITTLVSFKKTDGAVPATGLTLATDGALYGTTSVGGKYNAGTIFRITTDGIFKTLFHFTGANGSNPGGLVQGLDGKLYGATVAGGKSKLGTVFEITTNGLFKTIYHLAGADGAAPSARLTPMPDGTLYGVAARGGFGAGLVYQLGIVPPTIVTQPLSRTNALRSTAVFSVKVSGPAPFTYQWLKNGTPIARATRSALTLTNLQYSAAGEYSVIVSNMDGSTLSSNALLTIAPPPFIVSQPENQTATAGTTTSFSVVASSLLPMKYQWMFKNVAMPGKTNSTLTLSNVQPANAGVYRVVVKNGSGSISSSNAVLTIQTCSYVLSTNIVYIDSTGGSGSVGIDANFGDCNWLTANTNAWITLTSGTVNAGNGNVTFDVAANTNTVARIGSIFTAGTNFLVVQAGTFAPTSIKGKTFTFRLDSGAGANFTLVTSLASNSFIRIPTNSAPTTNYVYQRTSVSGGTLTLPGAGFYQLTYDSPYTGTYVYIATNSNVGSGTFAVTDSRPDYNRDGHADLLSQNTDGSLRVSFLQRTNYLQSVFLQRIVDFQWSVVGQADFDGDGNFDQVLQSSGGAIAVYFMQGTNFIDYTFLNQGNAVDTAWKIVGVRDMDNDGNADLLWQHTSGPLWIWLMEGVNVKSSFVLRNGASPGAGWKVVALADFNDDGQIDIMFQQDSGYVAVWFMNGTSFISPKVLFNNQPLASNLKIRGVNDFNADGHMDLLLQNTNGDLFVWFMDGTTRDSTMSLSVDPPQAAWKLVGPK